jgi:UDP-GlcNAc:undecaprenyl-phosphate GlcNAc-1-phosphate transferase
MQVSSLHLITVLASLVLALVLTPVVRALARRWGAVAKPKTDRWHKKPTAMLGGVAIWFSVTLVMSLYLLFVPHETPYGWVVVGSSSFLFFVGLADDLFHAKPYQKLIGQVMGAAFVIYYGLSLPWTSSAPVNMGITIFWLIGITNAVNLLDNMDGLAAGIAAIASAFLALSFVTTGQMTEALMLAVFAAALVGFLIYNSNPASIFMGDCGSMFIGFFLASTALMSSAMGGRSRSFLPVLAVPILILFIPIFDTTFVTVLRKLSGRSASQGGRDHTSHRLVALGMSERRAVWMLYGFAGLSGLLAMLVREAQLEISLPVILGFTVILTLLGVYLAGVKVYDEEEVKAAHDKPLFAFLIDLSYKRRIFEVLLDVVLIILAYYCAYVLRFGAMSESGVWRVFLQTLPVLVFVKMATLLVMGVYRGIWRYTSVDDLINIAKAIIIGSVLSMLALLFKFRFESLSRTVFILDAMLLLLMLAGSRMAFRLFRQMLPASKMREGCRVLIYGAGDAGELLLRELLNNRELQYAPVGFVDDDPNKKGKVIHGLRVFGGNGALSSICREQRIDEVLISSTRVSEERVKEIMRDCQEQHVTLKRMRIKIETISEE